MPVHLPITEMTGRRAAASRSLVNAGIDALLVFKKESMYYLTGYDTFGFSLFQCMILDPNGNTHLLTRLPDKRQVWYTADIPEHQIHVWIDAAGSDPVCALKALLDAVGLAWAKLGIELDSYGLKAAAWCSPQPSLDGFCPWCDAATLIDRLRARKSDAELGYVRRAAELADDAWDEACRLSASRAYEGDILAAMQGAVFRGGGDYVGNEFIIGSGPAALLVRYQAHRRHLDADDQMTLEWAGAYRRYHAAMMRTVLVGKVHARHQAMFEACHEALNACVTVLKPRATMGRVFDAHAEVLDAAGMASHRMAACGYGMGAVYNPLWVDPPMFYTGNELLIEERNVFFLHMILADSESGLGMTLGQTVVVTATGCGSLSRTALTLPMA